MCHLLITFANGLDLNQAGQNVRPDLDPNCGIPGRIFQKTDFENKSADHKMAWNITQ